MFLNVFDGIAAIAIHSTAIAIRFYALGNSYTLERLEQFTFLVLSNMERCKHFLEFILWNDEGNILYGLFMTQFK